MNLQAIVLAGGLGTRLREVVRDVPKPMAQIGDRPFLDILLWQLAESTSVKKVVLALGYMASTIQEAYQNHSFPFELQFVTESEPLGTGGAIKHALSTVSSNPVLVLNGDSFVGFDLDAFLKFYLDCKGLCSLVLAKVEDVSRYGRVEFLVGAQQVTAFCEKESASVPGWINAGVYLLNPEIVQKFPEDKFSLERQVFPQMGEGQIFAYCAQGKFVDIGTPESFHFAQDYLKEFCN